jgi:hypothetical protein
MTSAAQNTPGATDIPLTDMVESPAQQVYDDLKQGNPENSFDQ